MANLTIEVDCTNEDNPVYRVQEMDMFDKMGKWFTQYHTVAIFHSLKEAEAYKRENEE